MGLECGAEQGLDLIHQAQKQRIEMADKWLGQGRARPGMDHARPGTQEQASGWDKFVIRWRQAHLRSRLRLVTQEGSIARPSNGPVARLSITKAEGVQPWDYVGAHWGRKGTACFTSLRPVLYSGASFLSGGPCGRGSIEQGARATRDFIGTLCGAPPPPHAYNPGFHGLSRYCPPWCCPRRLRWWPGSPSMSPGVERVPDAERALSHMVGRLMDQEEGLKTLPVWEQVLYDITMGSDANDRDQVIRWYRELAEESADPFVDLHLAILEGVGA